jgi:hypothetical protein
MSSKQAQKKSVKNRPSKSNGGKELVLRRNPVRAVRQEGAFAAPLAKTRVMRTRVPDVSGSPYGSDGRIRIRHREYVGEVLGSVLFGATSFSINPGLQALFPWLSVIAPQFESYVFRSLKFLYETQKSASTSGSVMMAVDFDAADAAPANKQQLMAFHNAVRSAVWESCVFKSDGPDLKKFGVQRYLRTGNLAANLDVKTYDVGNFIVATQGEADASAIGELYVEYDVELITPQLASDPAAAASASITTTGASSAAPYTGAQTVVGGLAVSASGTTITFQRVGQYICSLFMTGVTATNVPATLGGTATSTAIEAVLPFDNGATTKNSISWLVTVNERGQTCTTSVAACWAVSMSSCVLRIAPYSAANA